MSRYGRCMTWAIAMPGFPTGGVLLADVRVSFVHPKTGRTLHEHDGLQKVHRVAANLAVAFAGSVEAGLLIAEDLKHWLSAIPADHVWSPARIAQAWPRRLRHAWGHLPADVTAGALELLLVGAFPGDTGPFVHSDGFVFRSPRFALERIARGRATSIGSGSDLAEYRAMLETFADEWPELSQFVIQGFPGGPAGPMSVVLGELIQKTPARGVSSQLVFCLVAVRETAIYTVDSPRPELSTPPLIATVAEWRDFCSSIGRASASAIAADSVTRNRLRLWLRSCSDGCRLERARQP